jgi:hypothetical protein
VCGKLNGEMEMSVRTRIQTWILEGYHPAESPTNAAEVAQLKFELARRSYEEVLDATKHQDDKVGRFLTAIAFLTTGAITLIASGNGLKRTFSVLDGPAHPYLAWSTGAFFILTLASVALLLLCLSTPLKLPRRRRDPMDESLLFFSYISARRIDDWKNDWEIDEQKLRDRMTQDYVREAHNLAERATAKYRHTYEAAWLFVVGLLFLGVSVFLKLVSLFYNGGPVALDRRSLVAVAAFTIAHAGLQIYTRGVNAMASMQKAWNFRVLRSAGRDDEVDDRTREFAARSRVARNTPWLIAPVVLYCLALVLPVEAWWHGECFAVGIVAVGTLTPLMLARDRWRYPASKGDTSGPLSPWAWSAWRWPAVVTVAATGSIGFLVWQDGALRVVAIAAPAVLLGLWHATWPARRHRLTRHLVEALPPRARVAD